MEERRQTLYNFLKEGQKVKIITKQKLYYHAEILNISNSGILILDKFKEQVVLPFEEIAQLTIVEDLK